MITEDSVPEGEWDYLGRTGDSMSSEEEVEVCKELEERASENQVKKQ